MTDPKRVSFSSVKRQLKRLGTSDPGAFYFAQKAEIYFHEGNRAASVAQLMGLLAIYRETKGKRAAARARKVENLIDLIRGVWHPRFAHGSA